MTATKRKNSSFELIFFLTKSLSDREITKDFFITEEPVNRGRNNVKFMIKPFSIVHLLRRYENDNLIGWQVVHFLFRAVIG